MNVTAPAQQSFPPNYIGSDPSAPVFVPRNTFPQAAPYIQGAVFHADAARAAQAHGDAAGVTWSTAWASDDLRRAVDLCPTMQVGVAMGLTQAKEQIDQLLANPLRPVDFSALGSELRAASEYISMDHSQNF